MAGSQNDKWNLETSTLVILREKALLDTLESKNVTF